MNCRRIPAEPYSIQRKRDRERERETNERLFSRIKLANENVSSVLYINCVNSKWAVTIWIELDWIIHSFIHHILGKHIYTHKALTHATNSNQLDIKFNIT